jgi:hypothetical protein
MFGKAAVAAEQWSCAPRTQDALRRWHHGKLGEQVASPLLTLRAEPVSAPGDYFITGDYPWVRVSGVVVS